MRFAGLTPLFMVGMVSFTGPWLLVAGPLDAQERTEILYPQSLLEEYRAATTSGTPLPDARNGPSAWGEQRGSGHDGRLRYSPWVQDKAFLASAILPGSGQWILGQRRWALYLAVEAAGWFEYVRRRNDGRDLRRAYRDLAWEVAREPVTAGQRVDGTFEYYEIMTRYPASGAFDRSPEAPGIRPETDPSTYNGMIWGLARGIFFPPGVEEPAVDSPEYAAALEYYVERGYSSELGWDWRGQEEERDRFGSLIHESDESFRRSTTMLGVLIGNRVLSSIDALISERIRPVVGNSARLELRVVPMLDGTRPDHQRDFWALQATLFH